MAKRFEIIGSALVVTDTVTGKVALDIPASNAYPNYEELRDNNNIRIYDVNGVNFRGIGLVNSLLTDSVDSLGITFTATSFLEFSRRSLASNNSIPTDSKSNIFQFLDGQNHDATINEFSLSISTPFNFAWNVLPTSNSIVGVSQYTIEVSNDDANWFDYATVFTNVVNADGVEDENLTFNYMRIKHIQGTSTSGTITYTLTEID